MIPVNICKKSNPKEIIESDDVHYFYWPLKVGLGYVKIMGKKFPAPVKQNDWEPIKTMDVDGKTTIGTCSRPREVLCLNGDKMPEKLGRT